MGNISKRLHRKLASKSGKLPTKAPKRRPGEPLPGNIKDVEMLIKDGLDPVHAAYAYIQQISAHFSEGVSQLPEMKQWARAVEKAQDEYMPSGPPMSPLTGSYFATWVLYDFRIGGTGDTMAECQIDANDLFLMNLDQLHALKKQATSRMGIYEHVGMVGPHVRLRELISDDEFICHSSSGYQGHEGELWYVRLLPPLMSELADYHTVFTTPYVLIHTTIDDWVNYLQRSLLQFKSDDERQALYRLLKYGLERHYWNEFVVKAYHHFQYDAIFLAGIPDLQYSLPHA